MKKSTTNFALLLLAILPSNLGANTYWNQFRGPNNGIAPDANLPIEFSDTKNVQWRTPIHDLGWSSPVVWKDQVWLTTAKVNGSEVFAVCVDLETGKKVHDIKVFDVSDPQTEYNHLNTHATPTPIIEEGRIYVHFGSYGTACLDTKTGKKLWERRDLNCDHRVRAASCPIIDGDLLFLTYDGVDNQFVAALDKESGKTRWITKRSYKSGRVPPKDKPNDNRKSYATPTIIEHNGKKQLISPAAEATYSYDPATGEEFWFIRHGAGFGYNVTCKPIFRHGLVFTNSGISKNLFAIDPSGSGDVTDSHIRWKTRRGVSNIPAPLVVGDFLYMITDSGGMVSCYKAKTGEQIYSERLGGLQNHWVSPVYANGKIYLFSRDGIFSVIEASSKFNVLYTNESDTTFVSMPAIVGNSMLLRSNTHLYRIANGYEIEPLPKIAFTSERSKKRNATDKKDPKRNSNSVVAVTAYFLGGKENIAGVFECSFLVEDNTLPKEEWGHIKFTGEKFRDTFSGYKQYQKVTLDLAERKLGRKK